MKIVWDEIKRQENLRKRRLDFAELEDRFDWSDVLYIRRTQVQMDDVGRR